MSFAVVHMQKIKMGGIKGIENHNERLKESRTNPDINPEKSHLNQNLYEHEDERSYYNRVKDRIKELNLPKAVRKDAVTMCGFVCTSDKDYFDKLPKAEQERFFKESYEFLKNRYGEKNVVAANVHFDEKTPHLHCYVVPVTEDGRLSAKDIFTRAELQKLQTDYPKHMNEKGFELERGLSSEGKRKHLDTQEFKIQTKQQEIEKAQKEFDRTLNKLQNEKEALRDTTSSLYDLEHLDIKKSLIGAKITLSEKDFNKLMDMAKKGIHNSRELNDLKREYNWMKDNTDSYRRVNSNNESKISELKQENQKLKGGLKDLKEQGKAMYETLKKHDLIPEAQDYLRNMREAEKVAEKVLSKAPAKSWGMER